MDAKKCGAQTEHGPCKKDPMENGRCYFHGGATPSGVASPHFKHGRYSKALPNRLIERYEEALQDAELTNLREELALVDARIFDMLTRVDTGESGEQWSACHDQVGAIRELEIKIRAASGDKRTELTLDREVAFETLVGLVQEGMADYAAWREVLSLIERRRKLAESQTKREQIMKLMVPVAEVVAMKAAIGALIRDNVKDPDALSAIVTGLDRLGSGSEGGDRSAGA